MATLKSIEFEATDGEKVKVDFNDRWAMYRTFGAITHKKFTSEGLIEWCNQQVKFLESCIENVKACKTVAELTYVKELNREQLEGILALMAENAEINE